MEPHWHVLSPGETVNELGTDARYGLSDHEAARRLAATGPNELATPPPPPWWRLFIGQFSDFMVLVLLAATAVSFWLGEVGDAVTIVAIVVMNAVLGFLQEFRAEQAIDRLKVLTAPTARVTRGGVRAVVAARDLVPGDLVSLEAGDRVPADLRVLEAWSLEADESTLTGESHPASKRVPAIQDREAPLADRQCVLYAGTLVTRGRGEAVATATGMATQMGHIAHLIHSAEDRETPLEARLQQLGRVLVGLSLAIVLVVVAAGIARGEPLYRMFLTGVSLAVAAIPEGLPAIVTVALALGIQRMIRHHAIVRRLPAVETLGSVTVIASDKTGTLTQNRMTVVEVLTEGQHQARDGTERRQPAAGPDGAAERLWTAAVMASSAAWPSHSREGTGDGDPTEVALLEAAFGEGVDPSRIRSTHRKWGEKPFESERRRMAVAAVNADGASWAYVKGAPDVVLGLCRTSWEGGRVVPLDAARRAAASRVLEGMTDRALRVLAIAHRPVRMEQDPDTWEHDLTFLGLVGLMDPPRPEAIRAVAACRRAGIRTLMITGDHPKTAAAVARALGILPSSVPPRDDDPRILTGREVDGLDDAELAARLDEVRVFARVSPPHKLRVVRLLKQTGHVVAMTGDGVNDAPAVKEADIGVAMGITGTDVTKEASDMILTDDNFATIVRAVREGRAIYDNVRKFMRYLLSCNVGEVLVMLLAVLVGLPLPLLPIQILFVNLVTDGLPALALGVDPPSPGVMDRPPRPPRESIFARGLGSKIAIRGMLIGTATLAVFWWSLRAAGMGLPHAETLALATLVMSQLFHVFDARAEDRNFLEVGFWSNPWAILAVLSSIIMLAAVVYVPSLSGLFKTAPLSMTEWAVVLAASGFVQVGAALRYLVAPTVRRTARA